VSPLNLEKKDFSQPAHRSPSNYLGSALVEAAEKLEFAWHDCLPVKRIKAGITEMTLGACLCSGRCPVRYPLISEDTIHELSIQ